jgi:L-lysine 2,3-aminomutase
VPTFVVDAPGGGGKIPVHPNYVVSQHEHKFVLRNFDLDGSAIALEPSDLRRRSRSKRTAG